MAGRGSKDDQRRRTEAERARRYAAHSEWHDREIRRRVRDNTVAGIAGGILVLAAFGSQVVHAQVTAPAPAESPSPVVTPSGGPEPIPSDAPSD